MKDKTYAENPLQLELKFQCYHRTTSNFNHYFNNLLQRLDNHEGLVFSAGPVETINIRIDPSEINKALSEGKLSYTIDDKHYLIVKDMRVLIPATRETLFKLYDDLVKEYSGTAVRISILSSEIIGETA